MKTFLVVLTVIFFLLQLYIRFSPADPADWHRPLARKPVGDWPETGGFTAVRINSDPQVLSRLLTIATDTPRTTVIGAPLEEQRFTVETRSLFWGFPDYTTAELIHTEDGIQLLMLHGRLRFGRSDMGVNETRIRTWLKELDIAGARHP